MIVLFWFILCFVVAGCGSSRKIGAVASFFTALFLSPLVGFIVVALSERVSEQEQ